MTKSSSSILSKSNPLDYASWRCELDNLFAEIEIPSDLDYKGLFSALDIIRDVNPIPAPIEEFEMTPTQRSKYIKNAIIYKNIEAKMKVILMKHLDKDLKFSVMENSNQKKSIKELLDIINRDIGGSVEPILENKREAILSLEHKHGQTCLDYAAAAKSLVRELETLDPKASENITADWHKRMVKRFILKMRRDAVSIQFFNSVVDAQTLEPLDKYSDIHLIHEQFMRINAVLSRYDLPETSRVDGTHTSTFTGGLAFQTVVRHKPPQERREKMPADGLSIIIRNIPSNLPDDVIKQNYGQAGEIIQYYRIKKQGYPDLAFARFKTSMAAQAATKYEAPLPNGRSVHARILEDRSKMAESSQNLTFINKSSSSSAYPSFKTIVDSGCSKSASPDPAVAQHDAERIRFLVGNNSTMDSSGKAGSITGTTPSGEVFTTPTFMHVPDAAASLLSVTDVHDELKQSVLFDVKDSSVKIGEFQDVNVIATGSRNGGVFELNLNPVDTSHCAYLSKWLYTPANFQWHFRTHISEETLARTYENNALRNFDFNIKAQKSESSCVCEACIMGKMHQLPHPRRPKETFQNPIRVAVVDALIKPCKTKSVDRCEGFLSIILPGCLNYTMGFGFRKRSEIADLLSYSRSFLERKFPQHKLESFLCDQAGEHRPAWWLDECRNLGIQIHFSATDEHQTLGLVEGWNRIMMERYRTRLYRAKSPPSLWVYGLLHECMIHNYFVPKGETITPYESVHQRKPSASNIKNLFCVAYARVLPKNLVDKTSPRARKGRFLGCTPDWAPVTTFGYIILLDDTNLNTTIVSRDVYFLEDIYDVTCQDPLLESRQVTQWDGDIFQPHGAISEIAENEDVYAEESTPEESRYAKSSPLNLTTNPVNNVADPVDTASVEAAEPNPVDEVIVTLDHMAAAADAAEQNPVDDVVVPPNDVDEVDVPLDEVAAGVVPSEAGEHVSEIGEHIAETGEANNTVPSETGEHASAPRQAAPQPRPPSRLPRPVTRSMVPGGLGSWKTVLSSNPALLVQNHESLDDDWFQFQIHDVEKFLPTLLPTHTAYFTKPGPPLAQALEDPRWCDAVQSELQNFEKFGVWKLVRRTADHTPVKTLWVLCIKVNEETGQEKFKARLVMDGSRQIEGVDFTQTYAATPEIASFKIFLSIAVHRQMHVSGGDAQSAHLQAPPDTLTCINIPKGMTFSGDPRAFVLELQRTMYGQRQAPQQWEKHRNTTLTKLGFDQCPHDPCIFIRRYGQYFILIHTHADDFAMARDPEIESEFQSILAELQSLLHLKIQDKLSLYLGFVVTFSSDWSSVDVSQESYALRIIDEFLDDKRQIRRTPWPSDVEDFFDSQCPQSPEDIDFYKRHNYNQLVGKLIYLLVTRPELSYYVGKLARFLKSPRIIHWQVAQHLLAHLNGTSNLVTNFSRNPTISRAEALEVLTPPSSYSDSDWAGDTGTRRSTSGKAILINGAAVLSSSKRQATVADSTVVAETNALCSIAKDVVWIQDFLKWLGYVFNQPLTIHCDNQGTIRNTVDGALRHKTKHMDLKYMFLRDLVRRGLISVNYLHTDQMVADVFTKPLRWIKFEQFRSELGIKKPMSIYLPPVPDNSKGSMEDKRK